MNFYAHEKIRELEEQRLKALAGRGRLRQGRNKPAFGSLAAFLGGSLRRVGEGLEAWAGPQAQEAVKER